MLGSALESVRIAGRAVGQGCASAFRRDTCFDGASLRITRRSRLCSRPNSMGLRKRAVILQRVLKESLHALRMPRWGEGCKVDVIRASAEVGVVTNNR